MAPPRIVGTDGVELVLEAGGDAEVAAAAAQPPEQVAVLAFGRPQHLAVRGDEVDRREIVAGPAEPPREVAEAAAERQPRAPGRGDEPEHGREPMDLRLRVDVAEEAAGLGVRHALRGIDPHAAHQRHVEHQPAFADGQTGDVVAAAFD